MNILKEKRLEKNMTLEQVGNLIGVGKSTVRKWENGMIENMGRDKIILLSRALNISPLDILEMNTDDGKEDIKDIYLRLNKDNQSIVYDFAKSKLDEQNTISDNVVPFPTTLNLDAVVAAGTGEWQDDNFKEEIEYDGQIPSHDYVVRVNGDSMQPLFEDNQILFIRKTHEVRDGQIIVCMLNNETYVKKIMGNRLVSLNKKYDDIQINEYDDFSVVGVVVL
ncbi:helix-turn-helix transcriptional regulator [Enterococcus cecorum]|uniref:XRE family transcriptional regulator n=1 Tax=Enterococcus cecorum TaxID=44008 RepID=UPI000AC599B1|nr:XRE family transcriptional regulator [Enterococcus cecorum]CAI3338614.1 helix-turn-helix transcriptional regulator [Enterococcus cecorum]